MKSAYIIRNDRIIGGGSSSGTAEGITYENADYSQYSNVDLALDALFAKVYYVKPTCSLSASPVGGNFEMGTTIAAPITFTWTTNKDITTQTLTNCTLADETVRTATYDTDISSDKSFTLTVSDSENSASSTVSYKFMNKVHHGAASIPDAYDSTFIFSLGGALKGNKNGSYTANVGDGQYFYIAMPTSYNNSDTLTGKIGGFDTDFGKVATIEHTNASGYTCDYNIYKSTNANLGSITMTI